MTPAVETVRKSKIPFELHQYETAGDGRSWGLEAAEKMALPPAQVFKTLIAQMEDDELVVAVLPVDARLSLKAIARASGHKKARMAEPARVERVTGYILGGVSPVGQKQRLKTVVDSSSQQFGTIYVSGGRRGLEIGLAPDDLVTLTSARVAHISE